MVAAKMEDGDVKGSPGTTENRGEHGTKAAGLHDAGSS